MVYYSEESRSGTIHSPGYPASYTGNLSCLLFVFFANVSETVQLDLLSFNLTSIRHLHSSKESCANSLKIYLSELDELQQHDQAEHRLCGSQPKGTFSSKGRSLFLELRLQAGPVTGFLARYRFAQAQGLRPVRGRRSTPVVFQGVRTSPTPATLPSSSSSSSSKAPANACRRVFSAGKGLTWSDVLWSGANCTKAFRAHSVNTTFVFNASVTETVQLAFLQIEFADRQAYPK